MAPQPKKKKAVAKAETSVKDLLIAKTKQPTITAAMTAITPKELTVAGPVPSTSSSTPKKSSVAPKESTVAVAVPSTSSKPYQSTPWVRAPGTVELPKILMRYRDIRPAPDNADPTYDVSMMARVFFREFSNINHILDEFVKKYNFEMELKAQHIGTVMRVCVSDPKRKLVFPYNEFKFVSRTAEATGKILLSNPNIRIEPDKQDYFRFLNANNLKHCSVSMTNDNELHKYAQQYLDWKQSQFGSKEMSYYQTVVLDRAEKRWRIMNHKAKIVWLENVTVAELCEISNYEPIIRQLMQEQNIPEDAFDECAIEMLDAFRFDYSRRSFFVKVVTDPKHVLIINTMDARQEAKIAKDQLHFYKRSNAKKVFASLQDGSTMEDFYQLYVSKVGQDRKLPPFHTLHYLTHAEAYEEYFNARIEQRTEQENFDPIQTSTQAMTEPSTSSSASSESRPNKRAGSFQSPVYKNKVRVVASTSRNAPVDEEEEGEDVERIVIASESPPLDVTVVHQPAVLQNDIPTQINPHLQMPSTSTSAATAARLPEATTSTATSTAAATARLPEASTSTATSTAAATARLPEASTSTSAAAVQLPEASTSTATSTAAATARLPEASTSTSAAAVQLPEASTSTSAEAAAAKEMARASRAAITLPERYLAPFTDHVDSLIRYLLLKKPYIFIVKTKLMSEFPRHFDRLWREHKLQILVNYTFLWIRDDNATFMQMLHDNPRFGETALMMVEEIERSDRIERGEISDDDDDDGPTLAEAEADLITLENELTATFAFREALQAVAQGGTPSCAMRAELAAMEREVEDEESEEEGEDEVEEPEMEEEVEEPAMEVEDATPFVVKQEPLSPIGEAHQLSHSSDVQFVEMPTFIQEITDSIDPEYELMQQLEAGNASISSDPYLRQIEQGTQQLDPLEEAPPVTPQPVPQEAAATAAADDWRNPYALRSVQHDMEDARDRALGIRIPHIPLALREATNRPDRFTPVQKKPTTPNHRVTRSKINQRLEYLEDSSSDERGNEIHNGAEELRADDDFSVFLSSQLIDLEEENGRTMIEQNNFTFVQQPNNLHQQNTSASCFFVRLKEVRYQRNQTFELCVALPQFNLYNIVVCDDNIRILLNLNDATWQSLLRLLQLVDSYNFSAGNQPKRSDSKEFIKQQLDLLFSSQNEFKVFGMQLGRAETIIYCNDSLPHQSSRHINLTAAIQPSILKKLSNFKSH